MKASSVDDFLGIRSRANWRRRLQWTALAVALVALVVLVGRFVNGGAPTRYVSVEVRRADLAAEVGGAGVLQSAGHEAAGAPMPGVVGAVLAHEGEAVRQGQVVARLDEAAAQEDTARARSLLAARRAALAAANARAAEQRATLTNYRRVRAESGGLAPSDREMALARQALAAAEANVRSAAVEAEAARALLAQSQARLASSDIRAPIAGVVARAPQTGQAVRGAPDEAVATIAAPYARLRLEVMLPEAAAAAVRLHEPAQVRTPALPSRVFSAEVAGATPAPGASASQVVLALDVDNSDLALRPGMPATARVDLGVRRQALVVPEAALHFASGSDAARGLDRTRGQAVYVVGEDGAPRRLPVQVVGQDGDRLAVASAALKPGMPVITGLR